MLENQIDKVIPKEVVYILTASGFDSKFSIKNLTHESIKEIEGFFNTNYSELSNGLVGTRYENTRPFRILPGHQALIKSLPQYIEHIQEINQPPAATNDFSYVLKLILESAENNIGREPKGRRYNESLSSYATFIYLMCGRACYEALSANLPIPQANTICEFTYL